MRAILVLLLLVLAGCTTAQPRLPPVAEPGAATISDLGALALIEALGRDGRRLWTASAGLDGTLEATFLGNESRLLLWESGKATVLDLDGNPIAGATFEGPPPIAFGARYAFPNPTFPAQLGTTCTEKTDGDAGCGLDEPSIVVDGRGWIYYTAACCFVVSSPVFVSKDGGQSFTELKHTYKDAYGNEGDVWLDAAGNLYYMDIDLTTWGFAQWDKDLKAVHGYRKPGEPVEDRPWVRATSDGVVLAIYNTANECLDKDEPTPACGTIAYRSTDHGRNFGPVPVGRIGVPLATAYSDSRRGIVGMVADGSFVQSDDHGVTWSARQTFPCNKAGPNFDSAAVDEGGTVWFLRWGCVVGRNADGAFTEAQEVVPKGLNAFFSWIAAGGDGSVAVAYYAKAKSDTDARLLGIEEDTHYTFLSYSADAGKEAPHWTTVLVDEEPTAGDLRASGEGRRLGDFMEVAIGPDGSLHVAYARNPEMDDSATAVYRGTGPMRSLAPSQPLVGPYG